MIESHPFKPFIPKGAKYLLLGSFPGRSDSRTDEWYYGTLRGQFWRILQKVYKRRLKTVSDKMKLAYDLRMAFSDTIYKCEREKMNNSDNNLKVLEYNTKIVEKILEKNKIEKIYFSSKFVEKIYNRRFKYLITKYPDIQLITLPSTSPRYASMSIKNKIKKFKIFLPPLPDSDTSMYRS